MHFSDFHFLGAKCDSTLRCTECPDGSAVDARGRCSTTSCNTIDLCAKCGVGGKCAWCSGEAILQPDGLSCRSPPGNCPLGSGWRDKTKKKECLSCASTPKCKIEKW